MCRHKANEGHTKRCAPSVACWCGDGFHERCTAGPYARSDAGGAGGVSGGRVGTQHPDYHTANTDDTTDAYGNTSTNRKLF